MSLTGEFQEDETERTRLLSDFSESSFLSATGRWATATPLTFSSSSPSSSYGSIFNNSSRVNNSARTVPNGNVSVDEGPINRFRGDARTDFADIEGGSQQQHEDEEGSLDTMTTSNTNRAVSGDSTGDSSRVDNNGDEQERQQPSEGRDAEEPRDGAIGNLTRRLRCLFSTVTWPIVPLGTIVSLALLWVLYAASSLDLEKNCSHPLHSYALVSLVLVAYIPNHSLVRSRMFHYSRERDGPIRPARVRMYDQFFHTICLLYVYTGVTLIQTCQEDIVDRNSIDVPKNELALPNNGPLNACQATCPNLYQAMSVYVATLELFTFALILPLLFLPCIYLWFLQRATAEADAFARLQDQLQEEDALLRNGGVTTGEILDSLETVKMVYRGPGSSAHEITNINDNPVAEGESEPQELWILPRDVGLEDTIGTKSTMRECCICMTNFDFEVEGSPSCEIRCNGNDKFEKRKNLKRVNNDAMDEVGHEATPTEPSRIVRTRCGHIFHEECLKGWVGGMWSANPNRAGGNNTTGDDSTPDWKKRKARQIYCPLCREDLRPNIP